MDPLSQLNESLGKLGIAQSTLSTTSANTSTQTAPAPAGNFFANAGRSVLNGLGAIPGAIGGALTAGNAVAQNAIAGTVASGGVAKSAIATSKDLTDRQIQYTKAYSAGQITKTRYTALMQDLQKQHAANAEVVDQNSRDIGNYGSRAKAGAQIGGTIAAVASLGGSAELPTLFGAAGDLAKNEAVPSIVSNAAGKIAAAGETTPGSTLVGGAKKFIQSDLSNQNLASTGATVGSDIQTGNYKDLALQGATNVGVPALVGAAGKYGPGLVEKAATALFGKEGGPIATYFGSKAVKDLPDSVKSYLKQAEAFTLDQPAVKDGKVSANQFFKHYVSEHFNLPEGATPTEFAAQFKQYADRTLAIQAGREAGTLPKNAVLTRDITSTIPKATQMLEENRAAFGSDRTELIGNIVKTVGSQNPSIDNAIVKAVQDAGSVEEAVASLQGIVKKNIFQSKELKLGKGFALTYGPKDLARIPHADVASELNIGNAPGKVAGKIGSAITKAGLSPIANDASATRGLLRDTFEANLEKAGVKGDASRILDALNSIPQKGASDARTLSKAKIQAVLGGTADAGVVRNALRDAYAKLPASAVGLGPSALNKVQKSVPAIGKYVQLQQAGRYDTPVLSAAFRGKQAVKGAFMTFAHGGFLKNASAEDYAALSKAGILDDAAKLGSDAALTDVTKAGANLAPEQRFYIGNLAASIAKAHGTTVDKILSDGGELADQMKQSLSLIHSYGKGGYLNSPLAKTLNLIIYPSRFDTKVAMAAGKAFANQPVGVQAAVATSIVNGVKFLGSNQGKKWQQDNSEALGLLKYFTPLGTLDGVMKYVNNGHHVGDLGEVGGLPFGIIGQMLHNQGINIGKLGSSQYTDPKTGLPVPTAIPTTDKSRLRQAMNDLLGSMFSYPGKTAGLGSKSDLVNTVTTKVVPALATKPNEVQYRFDNGQVAPPRVTKVPSVSTGGAKRTGSLPTATAPKLIPKLRTTKAKVLAKPRGSF